jgi:hypothetical protein
MKSLDRKSLETRHFEAMGQLVPPHHVDVLVPHPLGEQRQRGCRLGRRSVAVQVAFKIKRLETSFSLDSKGLKPGAFKLRVKTEFNLC